MTMRLDEALAPTASDVEPTAQPTRLGDVQSSEPIPVTRAEDNFLLELNPTVVENMKAKGPIGAVEAVLREDLIDKLPGPGSAIKSAMLLQSIDRLAKSTQEGHGISPEQLELDKKRFFVYAAKLDEEHVRGFTLGGKVARGVSEIPAFLIEFLATEGAASLGKAGVRKAVQAEMRNIVKSGTLKFTTRTAGALAGATLRTAAMPQRVVKSYAERQIDSRLVLSDKGFELAKQSTEKPYTSAMKAFGDVLIENFSEVTGEAITKFGKAALPKPLISGLENIFKKLHPNKAVTQLWTRAGYNGILQEMGEERLGNFLKALTGVEDFGADNPHSVMDRVIASIPNAEELLVEGLIFSFPGALNMGVGASVDLIKKRKLESKHVEPTLKDITPDVVEKLTTDEKAAANAETKSLVDKNKVLLDSLQKREQGLQANKSEPGTKEELKKTYAAIADLKKTIAFQESKLAQTPDVQASPVAQAPKPKKKLSKLDLVKQKIADTGQDAAEFGERILTPLSSTLGRINQKLKARFVTFEADLHRNIFKDEAYATPFMKAFQSLPEADKSTLDLALKNGDIATINEIVDRNDMREAFDLRTQLLKDIATRAKEVGFDFEELKYYHPRVIKDVPGFLEAIRFKGPWTQFDEALKEKQKETDHYMTSDEKASYINTLLRSKDSDAIRFTTPGAMKSRGMEAITEDLQPFYHDANTSLLRHIYSMNNAIAMRKFFGKAASGKTAMDNIDDSIGQVMLELLENKEISADQAIAASKVLKARFNEKGTSGIVSTLKNLAYIDVLGSPIKAITQFTDVALSLYKNGYFRTGKAILSTLSGKAELQKEDIYISNAAQEFSDSRASARALKAVFEKVGFTRVDSFGKAVFLSSAAERLQTQANQNNPALMENLRNYFGEEAPQTLEDLKAGKISDNVKTLLFSELLNVQPIALSEMPEAYATGGNGRAWYMLKTYTIKLFDLYRRDVIDTFKSDPGQAVKNFVQLSTALTMMGVGADAVKDFILGKDFDLGDTVIDNMWKALGLNRFMYKDSQTKGPVRMLFEQVLPPTQFATAIAKDTMDILHGEFDPIEAESIKSIPGFGEIFYWRVGGGRSKLDKSASRGGNEAP